MLIRAGAEKLVDPLRLADVKAFKVHFSCRDYRLESAAIEFEVEPR